MFHTKITVVKNSIEKGCFSASNSSFLYKQNYVSQSWVGCQMMAFLTFTPTSHSKRRKAPAVKALRPVRGVFSLSLASHYTSHSVSLASYLSNFGIASQWLWSANSMVYDVLTYDLRCLNQWFVARMINAKCPYVGHGLRVRRRRTESPLTTYFSRSLTSQ